MEKTIRTQFVKEFLEAVLTLESVDECMDFFEDVCTVKEVHFCIFNVYGGLL